MTVEVVTFGCRLNAYESDVIGPQARAAGVGDVIIVNTCAVTAEAVRQSRQTIRRIKRERPDVPVVVTGCAAQVEPRTFADMPEVALVLGNEEKLSSQTWREQRNALLMRAGADAPAEEKIKVNDIMAVRETAAHTPTLPSPARGGGQGGGNAGRVRAFVAVQNGCDHRCTFCVIPYGRGNSRSVPMGEVVAEVRKLCEQGYREVVLTGVDLTSYGSNLPATPKLGTLVKQILKHVPQLPRLRLSSIDSVEADRDLVDALATQARLMPHLHLSLQSGDDLILKRMKRRHCRADAIAFCSQVRRLRPDVVFGADMITGFPTETDAMFARSLDLVDACGLTRLHVFPFSPRPATPAARMPQLPRTLAKERARQLRARGEAAFKQHLDSQVGRRCRVLAESRSRGHNEQFTPVRFNRPAEPGVILDVGILSHDGRQLLAA
jgi:threonylcarbamoyladenosine tRNA methylthiotransferase MtaB